MAQAILIGALLAGVASAGALLLFKRGPDANLRGRQSAQPALATTEPSPRRERLRSSENSQESARSTLVVSSPPSVPTNTERSDGAPAGIGPATLAPLPEPTPYSRQLVGALCQLDPSSIPQTPEQVAEWKRNLQQLIAQGPSAVAAIREFLQKNVDLDFGPGNTPGYASVRVAMFDALVQIGGAEGVAGTLQTLQNTADPREIAMLAQNLEKLAPGQHRREAIEAARETLAMAGGGKLDGADVAPLFEVLRSYGDTSVVTDLMQAAQQWNYYSALALAQLPDGGGIPALIDMAQGSSGGKLNALEMLTQMSAQYPEAREALIEQARANKISPNMWPYLTPLLAGDLYHYQDSVFDSLGKGKRSNSAHVVMGNQYFYTAPAVEILAPDEINRRMAFITELEAVTTDPAALKALDQSRDLLASRQPQTVAVSP
jgi:hypothetical protein